MSGKFMDRVERNIIPIIIVSFLSLLAFLYVKDPDNIFQCNSKVTTRPKDSLTGKMVDSAAAKQTDRKWEYTRQKNEMGDSIRLAILKSSNIAFFDFPYNGGSIGQLIVRRRNNQLDLMFSVSKGQINFDIDGATVRVRFDDGPVKKYWTSRSSSGNTEVLFFNNEKELLGKIRRSKKMAVEVPFYSHGQEIFVFDVEGLEMN